MIFVRKPSQRGTRRAENYVTWWKIFMIFVRRLNRFPPYNSNDSNRYLHRVLVVFPPRRTSNSFFRLNRRADYLSGTRLLTRSKETLLSCIQKELSLSLSLSLSAKYATRFRETCSNCEQQHNRSAYPDVTPEISFPRFSVRFCFIRFYLDFHDLFHRNSRVVVVVADLLIFELNCSQVSGFGLILIKRETSLIAPRDSPFVVIKIPRQERLNYRRSPYRRIFKHRCQNLNISRLNRNFDATSADVLRMPFSLATGCADRNEWPNRIQSFVAFFSF